MKIYAAAVPTALTGYAVVDLLCAFIRDAAARKRRIVSDIAVSVSVSVSAFALRDVVVDVDFLRFFLIPTTMSG